LTPAHIALPTFFPRQQHSLAHWDLNTGKDVETRWVEFER
jgi:hypothetical protein